ncbi:NnrS family protein [Stenotrophomonas sp. SY1]|uniref:NnrS family protein n=1 Tax=Stenotrophomonas sp. SY1 TaxID=477235 RepID=UPI001E283F38|nr:NnrS family protein [Stenotrophomonas sp. SY1]MCD9087816.1 NnrS family protein [Stenotrophomonas sp. SY1]
MQTPSSSPGMALRNLGRTPHRLMFFIGASNLLLAMAWWALWLIHARWQQPSMPMPDVYPGWLHALVMVYLVFPSFIFGFLLTVFPRWMGLPELARHHYLPVGIGLIGGQLTLLLGTLGLPYALPIALVLALLGWSIGLWQLGRLLLSERGRTWHARSCMAALLLGYAGLWAFAAFVVFGASPAWVMVGIKLGGFGLLLPIYVSVAHRMFPFFAGNVVPGYQPWRPLWWLGAFWLFLVLHLLLDLRAQSAWLWLADLPLLLLSVLALWRWWPRGAMPGLLRVLFIGLAWLPVSLALYVVQSLADALGWPLTLGRGPAHALFIGLFGSLLVAMVTRVTQGHSGRPLQMTPVAWFAFIAIQAVAVMRVVAELMPDAAAWQALSAIGWLLAFSPWVARIGRIYLLPRQDGRDG